MNLNRQLIRLASPQRRLIVVVTALHVAVTTTYWAQAVALAHGLATVVAVSRAQAAAGELVAPLGWLLGAAVLRSALALAEAQAGAALATEVKTSLRLTLVRSALDPARLHAAQDRIGAGRVALTEAVDGVAVYVSRYVPRAVQVVLLCPLLLVVVTVLDWRVGLALAAGLGVALGGPKLWSRALARRSSAHWDGYGVLSSDFLEALSRMSTLRVLGAVPRMRKRLEEQSAAVLRDTVGAMRLSLLDTGIIDFGVHAGAVAAALLVAAEVGGLTGGAAPGGAATSYLVLLLASEVFRPVRDLSAAWHAGYLGSTALGPLDELRRGSGGAQPAPGGTSVAPGGRGDPDALVVRDVSFSYAPDSPLVLDHATCVFRRGGITALTGASGTGKSTLFDVVLGNLSADDGQVLLDGRAVSPSDAAVVSQHSYLFPGTVRDNLLVASPGASDDQVLAALEAAAMDEVTTWPEGLDTKVGEGGGELSGGQRQRLSLARALLSQRPVLLLDEPTSALDDERAAHVMATLRRVATERVVVMIAHRPEALDHAARRVEIVAGRTVDVTRTIGTAETLDEAADEPAVAR